MQELVTIIISMKEVLESKDPRFKSGFCLVIKHVTLGEGLNSTSSFPHLESVLSNA